MKNFRLLKNIIVNTQIKKILKSKILIINNIKKPTLSKQIPHYCLKSTFKFLTLPGRLYIATLWKPKQLYAKMLVQSVYWTPFRFLLLKQHLTVFFPSYYIKQLLIFSKLLSYGKNFGSI